MKKTMLKILILFFILSILWMGFLYFYEPIWGYDYRAAVVWCLLAYAIYPAGVLFWAGFQSELMYSDFNGRFKVVESFARINQSERHTFEVQTQKTEMKLALVKKHEEYKERIAFHIIAAYPIWILFSFFIGSFLVDDIFTGLSFLVPGMIASYVVLYFSNPYLSRADMADD